MVKHSLDDLPMELLTYVVLEVCRLSFYAISAEILNERNLEQLPKRDLKTVCLLSKRLCAFAKPLLWNSVAVHLEEEYFNAVNTEKLRSASQNQRGNLLLGTREFHVETELRMNAMTGRCRHLNQGDEVEEDRNEVLHAVLDGMQNDVGDVDCWEHSPQLDFRRVNNEVMSVLLKCKPGQLKTFKYAQLLLLQESI